MQFESFKNKCVTLFILCLLISCSKKEQNINFDEAYGVKFNGVRKEVGLEPLKTDWICLPPTSSGRYRWLDPYDDFVSISVKPIYLSKISLFYDGVLISESDVYATAKFNKPDNGEIYSREALSCMYYFVADDDFDIGWTYYYGGDGNLGQRGYVSENVADSILNSWNIKRP